MSYPLNIRTRTIHFVSSSDLDQLLEQKYGIEVNIAYSVMQERRKIRLHVSGWTGDVEESAFCELTIQKFKQDQELDYDVLEVLLCDQCSKGSLPAGEYMIEFDD